MDNGNRTKILIAIAIAIFSSHTITKWRKKLIFSVLCLKILRIIFDAETELLSERKRNTSIWKNAILVIFSNYNKGNRKRRKKKNKKRNEKFSQQMLIHPTEFKAD